MVTELVQWIDPDGVTTALDEWMSSTNRFMPKVAFQSDPVPGQPGEYFRDVLHGPREFGVVFDLIGTSDSDLRVKLRQMIAKLDPTRGPGRIRVTSPVGDQREIVCRYSGGGEIEETVGENSGSSWQRMPITFLAHDPYWYDVSPTSQQFAVTPLVASFFPFFPIKLTASELALDTVVDNTGDVETWPVWTIAGPGGVIRLSNLSTGKEMYFAAAALSAGQTITVDTRPGIKSITYDDGTNAYTLMSGTSSLWPIERGINTIRLEMSGVDTLTSYLRLTYWRRYLSP